MDGKKYNQIINNLSKDLISLEENLEIVVSRPYVDNDRLNDLKVNASSKIDYLNKFKVGLSKSCYFYSGFDKLSREYSNFKNKLKSNYNKFEEA